MVTEGILLKDNSFKVIKYALYNEPVCGNKILNIRARTQLHLQKQRRTATTNGNPVTRIRIYVLKTIHLVRSGVMTFFRGRGGYCFRVF